MNDPVFVDTNVLVYVRDARDPLKQRRAADWHDYLWHEQLGRTSMQVLSELHVTLRRLAGPKADLDDIWERVAHYLAWKPQAVDASLMRLSREIESRWRLSWWDSMIVAAAQLQGCPTLLTEDLQDGAVYGSVTVRSPFTLSLQAPRAAGYAVPALNAGLRRHRPAGRPTGRSRGSDSTQDRKRPQAPRRGSA